MDTQSYFQGVACCCLDSSKTVQETILKLLDLKVPSCHHGVECLNLDLSNKYYKATIHLFDSDTLNEYEKPETILEECHAIVLYANGQKNTVDQLDKKAEQLSSVRGEPRILIFDVIDEDCEPFKTYRDWSIKNSYDLIDACDDSARELLIDSLSAYKWVHRSDTTKTEATSTNDRCKEDGPQLNEELLKKLTDFDSLLGKLSAYRDRPELRGNPDDKNIEEIAEILSGLLEDDVDKFLDNEEGTTNNRS